MDKIFIKRLIKLNNYIYFVIQINIKKVKKW